MQEPALEDLSVTIKVLKVNNRKMTQSVFKQLEEKSLIDDNGWIFRGRLWGKVNYYWDKQSRSSYHVVWETEGTLYRDLIRPSRFLNLRSWKIDGDLEEYGWDYSNAQSNREDEIQRQPKELKPLLERYDSRKIKESDLWKEFERYLALINVIKKSPQLFISV